MAEHSHSCAGCRYEDNVYMACIGCGGKRYTPPEESEAEKAARRAGKAEGLREAAEILRGAADADARNAVYCSAPNHRERLQNLSENELVMAQRMLTRAEEVERE